MKILRMMKNMMILFIIYWILSKNNDLILKNKIDSFNHKEIEIKDEIINYIINENKIIKKIFLIDP